MLEAIARGLVSGAMLFFIAVGVLAGSGAYSAKGRKDVALWLGRLAVILAACSLPVAAFIAAHSYLRSPA